VLNIPLWSTEMTQRIVFTVELVVGELISYKTRWIIQ